MKAAQSAFRLKSSIRPGKHRERLAPRTAAREAVACRLLFGLTFGKSIAEREGKDGYICHHAHQHTGMQPCDLASDNGGVSKSDTCAFQSMSLKRISIPSPSLFLLPYWLELEVMLDLSWKEDVGDG